MRALGLVERPDIGAMAAALQWLEVPIPTPGRGEVRVRVVASALNRDDVQMAEGTTFGGLPITPRPTAKRPRVPGQDFAGIVDAIGSTVSDLKIGNRVLGVVYGTNQLGTLAPYCCTKASRLRPLPEGWTFEQGAAMPFSGVVASMSVRAAGDPSGKRCVVAGASGNIGGLIVQALVAAGAREVVGVCSGANAEHVRALGASRVVDYGSAPWGQQLAAESDAFDTVFDCVGGRDTEADALAILKPDGHFLTLCGPMRFAGDQRMSWGKILGTLGYIAWRTFASRFKGPRYILLSGSTPDWSAAETLLFEPDIRPAIDRVVPYQREDVAEAFECLMSNRSRGKWVVAVDPDGIAV